MKMEDGQKGEVKCFGCKKRATERHREGRGCDGQGNAYFAEWDADGGKTPAARIFLFSFTLNTTDHLLSLNLNNSWPYVCLCGKTDGSAQARGSPCWLLATRGQRRTTNNLELRS